VRFWAWLCQIFFVCGLVMLLVGTADELFGRGSWEGAESTTHDFLLYAWWTTVGAILAGGVPWARLRRERRQALLEAITLIRSARAGYDDWTRPDSEEHPRLDSNQRPSD
jgi:hypothetical protein